VNLSTQVELGQTPCGCICVVSELKPVPAGGRAERRESACAPLVVAVGLAAMVLSACGGGSVGPRAKSFDSVKEMVAAMKEGGVACTSLRSSADRFASDAGQCKVGGDTVTLDIYRDRSDRDAALRVAKGILSSGSVVVGPDWTAGSRSEALARKVQASLGGELQSL